MGNKLQRQEENNIIFTFITMLYVSEYQDHFIQDRDRIEVSPLEYGKSTPTEKCVVHFIQKDCIGLQVLVCHAKTRCANSTLFIIL